jgi:hypothetical protein
MTSHSGQTGVGFSGTSNPGTSLIIVDPSTETLLEAGSFQGGPLDYLGITTSYLPPASTPSVTTGGGSGSAAIQWLDPIGSPSIVGASSLPSAISGSTRDSAFGGHVK